MADLVDVPLEVTLTDGSRWIIYYRLATASLPRFAEAIKWLWGDIAEGGLKPADDSDGVQRRLGHINLAHVVSVREVEHAAGEDPKPPLDKGIWRCGKCNGVLQPCEYDDCTATAHCGDVFCDDHDTEGYE